MMCIASFLMGRDYIIPRRPSGLKFRGDILMLSPASLGSHNVPESAKCEVSLFRMEKVRDTNPYKPPTASGRANAINLLKRECVLLNGW